jgi:hypothetical protein
MAVGSEGVSAPPLVRQGKRTKCSRQRKCLKATFSSVSVFICWIIMTINALNRPRPFLDLRTLTFNMRIASAERGHIKRTTMDKTIEPRGSTVALMGSAPSRTTMDKTIDPRGSTAALIGSALSALDSHGLRVRTHALKIRQTLKECAGAVDSSESFYTQCADIRKMLTEQSQLPLLKA